MEERVTPPKYALWAYKTGNRARLIDTSAKLAVFAVVAVFLTASVVITISDVPVGLGFITFSLIPFVILTFARRLVNAKRPYEIYDVSGLDSDLSSRRTGLSFPSRHVFSAFLIGTVLLSESIALGAIVLALGLLIALARVVLLIHFVRDVIAGAVIGVLAGVLGVIALNLI